MKLSNQINNAQKDLGGETKNIYATSIQNFMEEVKKDFTNKPAKRKIKEPDNVKGSPDEVRAWCQRITLFFQSNNISKEWERIKMALGKIKGEKDNQA